MMNAGQVLEDIIWRRLIGTNEFEVVEENYLYNDSRGTGREIDDVAIHHRIGYRHYIVIVECKLGNRYTKAVKQLMYSRRYMRRHYPNARIFCIYVHNYNRKTHQYKVDWIQDNVLDREERKHFM